MPVPQHVGETREWGSSVGKDLLRSCHRGRAVSLGVPCNQRQCEQDFILDNIRDGNTATVDQQRLVA